MKPYVSGSLELCCRGIASLLALGLVLSACEASEKAETRTAALSPGSGTASAAPAASTTAPSALAPKAEPGSLTTLSLDPAQSKLGLVAAKVTRSHSGSFQQFRGSLTLAGDEVQALTFEVDTPSLAMDDDKLAAHVKTKDFLDVEKFPKATFESTSVVPRAAGTATHEITGNLTVHGVTQPITFPVAFEVTPSAVTGRGDVRMDRQKFGVTYPGMPDDLIKDEVVLQPVLVFPRKG